MSTRSIVVVSFQTGYKNYHYTAEGNAVELSDNTHAVVKVGEELKIVKVVEVRPFNKGTYSEAAMKPVIVMFNLDAHIAYEEKRARAIFLEKEMDRRFREMSKIAAYRTMLANADDETKKLFEEFEQITQEL